jgi:hypothetical protein
MVMGVVGVRASRPEDEVAELPRGGFVDLCLAALFVHREQCRWAAAAAERRVGVYRVTVDAK